MTSKIKKGIKSYYKDPSKKKTIQIIYEVLTLWRIKKHFPMHYFSRFLYRKQYKNYKDYVRTKEYYSIIKSSKIQNEFYVSLLENKFLFALFCEKHNLPVPKLVGYNTRNQFYWNQKPHTIHSNTDLIRFFNEIFEIFNLTEIFIKSIQNKGGKGIFLIEKKSLEQQIKSLSPKLLAESFIYQMCITQHDDINGIYAHSINTLRIDIFIDKDEKPHFLGSVMRFGLGGSVIDNRSKGGFFVSIDDETGCLMKKGYKQMGFGGTELVQHPDTGFIFEGFKIPFYKESKQLALEMSGVIPNKLIGWDVAITPKGPLIIEGNHDSNLTMTEVGYGGYMKHPLINELMSEKL